MITEEKVITFLKENEVCTLATNEPWCANVFYLYDEINEALLFISSLNSKHTKDIKQLSAAIFSKNPIKGIQLKGTLTKANAEQKKIFLAKFKSARFAINHQIYALKITYLKYTDNSLMLAKKIEIYN